MYRLDLSRDELVGINNVLNEILQGPDAIEEPEFHARVALTRAEASHLFDSISRMLRG